VAVCVALLLATVVGIVWAGAKVFRVGLLMQGKSATVGEMMRWVRAGR
jgi:ABC-2 type transport system permease protein